MSVLANIQERLQKTVRMIAELEREIPRYPEVAALRTNIRSLEKVKKRLEEEMLAEANAVGREVCRYRVLPEQGRAKLADLAAALTNYQSVVSVFYEAKRRGARQNARVSVETAAKTALDFGYAFAGSIGFVFTVPKERTLFDESVMRNSITQIAEVARAREPAEILKHADSLGPAPIRAMYRWADAHAKAHFGADIEWLAAHDGRQQMLIQQPEFQRLKEAITATSGKHVEEIALRGRLMAADAIRHSFRFLTDRNEKIKGKSGAVISSVRTVELPKRYKAVVKKTTRIHYSTEREDVAYELLHLEPL